VLVSEDMPSDWRNVWREILKDAWKLTLEAVFVKLR
jgi:hypothetical protein